MTSYGHVVHITNPVARTIGDHYQVDVGRSVQSLIDDGSLDLTSEPKLLLMGDQALLECEFDRVFEPEDVLTVVPATGFVFTTAAIIGIVSVAISVATAIYAFTIQPPEPAQISRTTLARDPGYKGNRARPGQSLPCVYGQCEVYPDVIGSWPEWDEINLLFMVTVGQCQDITANDIWLGDTPLTSFDNYQVEHIQPNQKSKQFTQQVVYSQSVNDLDFNDAGPTTSHVINPEGTLVTRIACRITAPSGAYITNFKGSLFPIGVTYLVQYREVGSGTWINGDNVDIATTTEPKRWERYIDVAPGRYEVRLMRSEASRDVIESVDKLVWNYARGWYEDDSTVDATRLAVRLTIDSSATNPVLSKVRVRVRRMLPTWDNGSWLEPAWTTSAAWAFADVLRASYGANLPDSRIDLEQLDYLAALGTGPFNGVFDAKEPLWNTLETIGRCVMARPIETATGVYTLVRDEPDQIPVAMFGMRNIVDGSFTIDNAAYTSESYDGVVVEFDDRDEDYRENAVECLPFGSSGLNLQTLKIPGVTKTDQAWSIGIRMANEYRWRRRRVSFETGIEGYIPQYSDTIRVHHHLIAKEQTENTHSGEIKSASGSNLTTYEDLSTLVDNTGLTIYLRGKDGAPVGPYDCDVTGPYAVTITESFDNSMMIFSDDQPGPLFEIALATSDYALIKVMGVEESGDGRIRIEGVFDDPNVYIEDEPPVLPPLLDRLGGEPTVTDLAFQLAGEKVGLRAKVYWVGRFADYYIVSASGDGESWEIYPRVYEENYTFILPNSDQDIVYIRVYGVSALRGKTAELTVDYSGYETQMAPIKNLRSEYPFDDASAAVTWDPIHESMFYAVGVTWENIDGETVGRGAFLYNNDNRWEVTRDYLANKHSTSVYGQKFPSAGARHLTFWVRSVLWDGSVLGVPSEITLDNEQVQELKQVSWQAISSNLSISFSWPNTDYYGVIVYAANYSGFVPSRGLVVHQGDSNDIVVHDLLPDDTTKYIRVAGYDIWGVDELNYSDEFAVVRGSSGVVTWDDIIGPKPPQNADVTMDNLPGDGVNRIPAQYQTHSVNELVTHVYASGSNADNFLIGGSIVANGLYGESALKLNNAFPNGGDANADTFIAALASSTTDYNITLGDGRFILGFVSFGDSNNIGDVDARMELVGQNGVKYYPANLENMDAGGSGYFKAIKNTWTRHAGVFDLRGLGITRGQLRVSLEEPDEQAPYYIDGLMLEQLRRDEATQVSLLSTVGLSEQSQFRGVGQGSIKTRQIAPGAVSGLIEAKTSSDISLSASTWKEISELRFQAVWMEGSQVELEASFNFGYELYEDMTFAIQFGIDDGAGGIYYWEPSYAFRNRGGVFGATGFARRLFFTDSAETTSTTFYVRVSCTSATSLRAGGSTYNFREIRR